PPNYRHPPRDRRTGRRHIRPTARGPPRRLALPEGTVVYARRRVLRSSIPWGRLAAILPLNVASMSHEGRAAILFRGSRLSWCRAAPRCMPAGMEILRTTPLESRSGTPPGRPSEAVSMNDVTRILSAIERGDPKAAEELLPLVYDELRKLAAQKLAHEKP